MRSGRKSRLRGTNAARRGAACARGRCASTASAPNLSRVCLLGRRVERSSNTTQCKAPARAAASPIWTTSFSNSVRNHCEEDKAPDIPNACATSTHGDLQLRHPPQRQRPHPRRNRHGGSRPNDVTATVSIGATASVTGSLACRPVRVTPSLFPTTFSHFLSYAPPRI